MIQLTIRYDARDNRIISWSGRSLNFRWRKSGLPKNKVSLTSQFVEVFTPQQERNRGMRTVSATRTTQARFPWQGTYQFPQNRKQKQIIAPQPLSQGATKADEIARRLTTLRLPQCRPSERMLSECTSPEGLRHRHLYAMCEFCGVVRCQTAIEWAVRQMTAHSGDVSSGRLPSSVYLQRVPKCGATTGARHKLAASPIAVCLRARPPSVGSVRLDTCTQSRNKQLKHADNHSDICRINGKNENVPQRGVGG
jgi:hypothetical protein